MMLVLVMHWITAWMLINTTSPMMYHQRRQSDMLNRAKQKDCQTPRSRADARGEIIHITVSIYKCLQVQTLPRQYAMPGKHKTPPEPRT